MSEPGATPPERPEAERRAVTEAPVLLAAGAVAAVALGAFVGVELRSEHPVVPVRFFRGLRFSAAAG